MARNKLSKKEHFWNVLEQSCFLLFRTFLHRCSAVSSTSPMKISRSDEFSDVGEEDDPLPPKPSLNIGNSTQILQCSEVRKNKKERRSKIKLLLGIFMSLSMVHKNVFNMRFYILFQIHHQILLKFII